MAQLTNLRFWKLSFHRYPQHLCLRSISSQSKHNKASTVTLDNDTPVNHAQWKTSGSPDPAYENIDLTFENAKEAYRSKKNSEIIRALLVFNLCSVTPLVNYNKEILKFARKVFGKTLFETILRGTFYGQFVAGEDENRIKPAVMRNLKYGVKSILDYSVEKDLSKEQALEAEMESCTPLQNVDGTLSASDAKSEEEKGVHIRYRPDERFGDRREGVTSARTYFYEDEEQCDQNMQIFLNSIDCVSGATNATGFAAIKLTALGRPQLLLQLSEVLMHVRRHFDTLAMATGDVTGAIKQKDFDRYLKRIIIDEEDRKRWYTVLDVTQDGVIDLLDWHNLLEVNVSLAKLLRVPNLNTGTFEPLVTCLTGEEEILMRNMLARVDTIVKYGKEKDVRVMIDAEQTYFQPAINRLTIEMMRKYNKEKPLIFNTYQTYLKDIYSVLTTDLALSKREGFHFGAKIVRGAYMEQERLRAATLGYEDPINPSYEATTAMYEKVMFELMKQIKEREKGKIAIMVASHNEETVRFTVNKMNELGIRSNDKVLCFGQLYGMCDQVSFSLGQSGYSVYKYVPYGPVEDVIPYLSRRALENRGVVAKVKKEKSTDWSELSRRLAKGQFFYKPVAPAVSPLSPPSSQ